MAKKPKPPKPPKAAAGGTGGAPVARPSPTSTTRTLAKGEYPGKASTARTAGTATIRVRALTVVYYDNARRRVGDVFDIHDPKHFSAKAMEYVDPREPLKTTTPNQALRERHDEILAGKHAESTASSPGITTRPEEDENPLGG